MHTITAWSYQTHPLKGTPTKNGVNGHTKNKINFSLTNKIDTLNDMNVLQKFRKGSDLRMIRAKLALKE